MIFFAFRSLLEAGGVDRLMLITRHRQRFSSRVVKFASQVLYSMWVHQELREVYRKAGWKETDFVTKTIAGAVFTKKNLQKKIITFLFFHESNSTFYTVGQKI